ncbi:MAG: DUF3990 domain-containing protein [Bacteroidales bacterium]|nr:DUF3990 domain-containing protein [Bacteroidales bacterium]
MELYLGSLQVEESPTFTLNGKILDHGKGFYATTSRIEARLLAQKLMEDHHAARSFVNIYEMNETAMDSLNCLKFKGVSKKWLKFVMDNRLKRNFSHNYDIVIGPTANDKAYKQFDFFEGEILLTSSIIENLRALNLVEQYSFHTQRALTALQFIEAVPVTCKLSQEQLRLLLPSKITWLVEYLHDDYGLSIKDCLDQIYHSNLYKKLSTESTQYWHLGPIALYNELLQELGDGWGK